MELWLTRAGSQGEFEQKFLEEGRIYLTWDELNNDLSKFDSRQNLLELLQRIYPSEKLKRLQNHSSQIWPFANVMQCGDWVVLPSKKQPVVYVGRITGDYVYNPAGPDPYYHWRSVEWFGQEIPRSHFGQDLLYSFGAFMTICRIQRNNALERLQVMYKNGWVAEKISSQIYSSLSAPQSNAGDVSNDAESELDLADIAKQQVIRLIESRFKGHELTRLVKAILEAQGYTTWQSPEGADGGVDILAGNGVMGFGNQTICVEVKSGNGTVDRPTVDKLLGAMSKFNANHGLFVAWGGFKQHVQRDMASSFFRLRLWSQDQLLDQLFAVYDKLDDELKAQLPLKRVWTVVTDE
ncbi:restriction endonuclease [Yersinia aldovae]|uniref:restriction endonuclease n=1 Tax=Yersinia aldovae TaxID=29483 RepID=UPI00119FAD01|nr:restriction endonuclease [Yersinia aldovae]EKN3395853.1 restriction endonuclease [Yersinia enterocolitica]EKN3834007.1 restriction endonuclease [Yersinia enterocolitica]EKN4096963.1 restriction endonuclease [Yersinia enterocolitica]EKN5127503.1 restriction endonuclease [Yersinia enterocolitica]